MKLMLLDAIASITTLYFAFQIRFDFNLPGAFQFIFFNWAPWFALLQIIVFHFAGLYARIWRYTSLFDLYAILFSVTSASAISVIFVFIYTGSEGYPRSVLLMYYILNALLTVTIRLKVYRKPRLVIQYVIQTILLKNLFQDLNQVSQLYFVVCSQLIVPNIKNSKMVWQN